MLHRVHSAPSFPDTQDAQNFRSFSNFQRHNQQRSHGKTNGSYDNNNVNYKNKNSRHHHHYHHNRSPNVRSAASSPSHSFGAHKLLSFPIPHTQPNERPSRLHLRGKAKHGKKKSPESQQSRQKQGALSASVTAGGKDTTRVSTPPSTPLLSQFATDSAPKPPTFLAKLLGKVSCAEPSGREFFFSLALQRR